MKTPILAANHGLSSRAAAPRSHDPSPLGLAPEITVCGLIDQLTCCSANCLNSPRSRRHANLPGFPLLRKGLLSLAAAALTLSVAGSARADLLFDPLSTGNYSGSLTLTLEDEYLTSVTAFNFDPAGNLYYMGNVGYSILGGIYKVESGEDEATRVGPTRGNDFCGTNVLSIGNNIYYNYSTYPPEGYYVNWTDGNGSFGSLSANNYSIGHSATFADKLFLTAGSLTDGGKTHLYYSGIGGAGALATPVDLGLLHPGYSGPMALDSKGNLYYSDGDGGSPTIYRWSAAELAAVINGVELTLGNATDHIWLDAGTLDAGGVGETYPFICSITFDLADNLLVSMGEVWSPENGSEVVFLGVGAEGAFNGVAETVAYDDTAIASMALYNGELYLASVDGDGCPTLYKVESTHNVAAVPEPSTWAMIAGGLGLLVVIQRRRSRAGGVALAA